jgi:small-conductance mechanosensitive channel
VQIKALAAEGDAKTQLLESVTKLKDHQTVLADRLKAVIEESKSKGGTIEDYEAYITAISGVKVDVRDASAAWTVITGWLMSSEGGIRWAKNILFFLVIILVSWVVSNLIGKAVRTAVAKLKSVSALLKDFIVNISRKAIFLIGFVVAILKDPAPVVKVHELADSSVNFVVRPWVATENYWDVHWDITRSVKEQFDAQGVSIPFPQQDVHLHQVATT